MTKRVLIAGLFHETNTFVEQPTRWADFQILRGPELMRCSGDSSPLGGVLDGAKEFGWTILPAVDFRAAPGGPVEDQVIESFWQEFRQLALPHLAAGVDAIYLVLHGAMVSESIADVEGEVLDRIRRLDGAADLPVFGVLDLHANVTRQMADRSNCLLAYRENPHTDARETARRAAALLDRALTRRIRPKTYWAQPPVLWPPTGTGTAGEPMRGLEELAREIESRHETIWAVNVLAGFSFADVAEAGVSFSISSVGPETEARSALDRLCQFAWSNKEKGNVIEPALDIVLPQLLESAAHGLTVVAEPSDNIGAGAPGDGTAVLRAFVEHNLRNAAVAINDPEAVRRLNEIRIGADATLPIGGKGSALDQGPFKLTVQLISRSDGQFQLEDPQSHLASMSGNSFDMGPCAVVRAGGVFILLSSRKTPPFDLAQWRSQGIDPEKLSLIGVKAAVAHQRAYGPIAGRMLWVNTPGPCCSDLTMLPFRRVRRPVYPLTVDPNISAPLAH